MTILEEITQDKYSCGWCHIPFKTSDGAAFVRFNKETLSYHKGECFEKAQKAAKREELADIYS